MAKNRTSWQRGVSGNPKGRPRVVFELRDAAREHGPRIIEILAQLAGIEGPGAANEAVRLGAARELLDRGYGRPVQAIADDASEPLVVDFRWSDGPPVQPDAATLPLIEAADAKADADPVMPWGSSC